MSSLSSVSKWKISTYILAATTTVALYRGHATTGADDSSSKPAARDASYDKRMSSLARLRIPAAMAGVDEMQLLRDLKAAGSVQQITLICERLGIFGTDLSLDALESLSKDRHQVAGPAIMAMGGIGSDRATDRLIEMMSSGSNSYQYYLVQALASTKNPRAELQLMEWAQGGDRSRQLRAVEALGIVGGEDAFEILQKLSRSNDTEVVHAVLTAAGTMATDGAVTILQEVADGGNRQLRIAALHGFPSSLNESQQEWLMNMLAQSDPEAAAAAADALGRAHVADALPLLLDAAKTGAPELRRGAVRALAQIGGPEAHKAVVELFASAGQNTAYDIGQALLDGGSEGRAAFLKAMKNGHRVRPQLIYLLSDLSGDDVDELRMDIARTGQPMEKQAALSQMAGQDNEEVIELMLDLAKNGPQDVRGSTLNLLAQNSSPRARQAILDIAQGPGQSSLEALRLLGSGAISGPEASGILIDALYSKNEMKMQTASWALAGAGTEEGREALVAAMQSDDRRLARIATESAGQLGAMPEVLDALQELAANSDDPQIKASALQQLVSSGSEQASRLVIESIKKGDSGTEYLISSVIMSGAAGSEDVVAEAAKSESPAARAALANALSMRGGDAESMRLLDTLSRDDDASVKNSAIYAMGSIGSRESVDRLIEMASSGDKEVRQVALSVVGNSGDPRATPLIVEAIGSGDTQLAQNAIYSAMNAGPEVDTALLSLAENGDADMYLRQQAVNALVNRGADVNADTLEHLQELTSANDPVGDFEGHFEPEF